jgi:hypothetical protein
MRSRNPQFSTVYGQLNFPPSKSCHLTYGRNGPAVIQRQAAIQQSAYQQSLEEGLDPPQLTTESVRYWSDFNRVDLFNSLDKEHDLLDRDLRVFAEEADHMQGIQVIAGVDDAWGGFAARYIDRIRDEYGKTTVYFWGLEDGFKSVPRVGPIQAIISHSH